MSLTRENVPSSISAEEHQIGLHSSLVGVSELLERGARPRYLQERSTGAGNTNDRIELGAGFDSGDITITRVSNSGLLIDIDNGSDRARVEAALQYYVLAGIARRPARTVPLTATLTGPEGGQARKDGLCPLKGFFSVFRLHQLGVPAVALMGRTLSPDQLALLEASGARFVTVLLDGDESGRSAAPAMMELLARSPIRAKLAVLPEGTQPDTVELPILRALLGLS